MNNRNLNKILILLGFITLVFLAINFKLQMQLNQLENNEHVVENNNDKTSWHTSLANK